MKGLLIDVETGDLLVKDGTLTVGDNVEQVTECVILAARGEFKEYPLLGAELSKQLGGNIDPMFRSTGKQMLEECGVPVKRVVFNDNMLTIE